MMTPEGSCTPSRAGTTQHAGRIRRQTAAILVLATVAGIWLGLAAPSQPPIPPPPPPAIAGG